LDKKEDDKGSDENKENKKEKSKSDNKEEVKKDDKKDEKDKKPIIDKNDKKESETVNLDDDNESINAAKEDEKPEKVIKNTHIYYFDSMGSRNERCVEIIKQYLIMEYINKFGNDALKSFVQKNGIYEDIITTTIEEFYPMVYYLLNFNNFNLVSFTI